MKRIEEVIKNAVLEAISNLYSAEVPENQISVQKTRKEFTGDFTVVVFPLLRF